MSLDFLLSTIPVAHDANPYIELLRRDGTLVIVGVFEPLEPCIDHSGIASWRRSVSGSAIGSMTETRDMIAFCAKHRIRPDVEIIPIQRINEAYERILKNDVKYRFVINMASLQ